MKKFSLVLSGGFKLEWGDFLKNLSFCVFLSKKRTSFLKLPNALKYVQLEVWPKL